MNQSVIVPVEKIWEEIKKAYNPLFIEELTKIPNAHVYAFGGIVSDLSLGLPWKDLDIRVILNIPKEQRDKSVIDILTQHTNIVQKFEFPEGTVVRVKVPNGKDMIVDVGIGNTLEKFRSDFTACSIFVDLKTGEIVEIGKNCVEDFKNKVIKPLDEPNQQLENDPTHLFRALKFAAKTGFAIDPQFGDILKEKKVLVDRVIRDVINYLRDNGKDSISEYFLGNIFGGLKSNDVVYINLLEEYGFLEEMAKSIQQLVCEDKNKNISLPKDNDKLFEKLNTLEEKLSVFLSIIAKGISENPIACFEEIKKAFAFDTNKSDGNEFVVNLEKINFVS